MKSWVNSSHHRRPVVEMFSLVSLPNRLLHPRTTEVIVVIQRFYFLLLTASNFVSTCFTSAFYCANFESIKYTNIDWRLVISGAAQGSCRKASGKCDPYYITGKKVVQIVECLWSCECNDKRDQKEHQHYPRGTVGFISHISYPVTSLHQWNWLNVGKKKFHSIWRQMKGPRMWRKSQNILCIIKI